MSVRFVADELYPSLRYATAPFHDRSIDAEPRIGQLDAGRQSKSLFPTPAITLYCTGSTKKR